MVSTRGKDPHEFLEESSLWIGLGTRARPSRASLLSLDIQLQIWVRPM